MERIIDGVLRFQREVHAPHQPLFHELAQGQSPSAMFIGCSDSRIIPETLTQQGPGELFVVRNAGNIVPPHSDEPGGVTASIEYAIEVLHVPDIIICGHSSCGAMTAILRGTLNDPDQAQRMPAVARWLHYADRAAARVDEQHPGEPELERLNALIAANVLAQLANLSTHPPVMRAVEERRLRLHGWVYDIASGSVQMYDSRLRAFAPLTAENRIEAAPV